MKAKNIPPYAPTLIESTRAIGYSLETAIADVIDNSITATASNVDIFFFPIKDAYIAILDDGKGIDSERFDKAMQYGSESPTDDRDEDDLGRFGLGLKTASLSQCRVLTVISKNKGVTEARRWDIDYVVKTGEWSLLILENDEIDDLPYAEKLSALESGTLVVWQNLDRLKMGETNFEQSLGRKMDDVRSHLSLVFHRYLSGETGLRKLNIRINNTEIEPIDPFLTKKSTPAMDDEVLMVRDAKVVIRPYILPHSSKLTEDELSTLGGKDGLRRQQGFYVYRNKRLLVWGTWFRMMRQGELSKLARILVDIPNALDDLWTLDIKKSTAIPPAEVKRNLESVIDRMAERSKRTWTFRGKKETDDSIIHTWNRFSGAQGGVYYEINRDHPLIEGLIDFNPSIKKSLDNLLKQIESSLPLNQLYVDLTSEKQFKNDVETKESDVEVLLKDLLEQISTDSARREFLSRIEVAEPFVNFPKLIERYSTEEMK